MATLAGLVSRLRPLPMSSVTPARVACCRVALAALGSSR
ncbi:hypothetical protein COLO4_01850 [Corchorus olitorius]|uniref:Uncharacterized protein n=1 Tax=Corchorus olitorius TaxID=93759 RepID=A0A1R3L238_9ROSI|nr:hypothetical protein COLO4_01850 [Corchorus olitorius]